MCNQIIIEQLQVCIEQSQVLHQFLSEFSDMSTELQRHLQMERKGTGTGVPTSVIHEPRRHTRPPIRLKISFYRDMVPRSARAQQGSIVVVFSTKSPSQIFIEHYKQF